MSKTILLLRHAKSSWDDETLDDFERPLAGRGKTDAPRIGRELARRGWLPATALVSAANRTRQTWKRAAAELPVAPPAVVMQELYDAPAQKLLDAMRQVADADDSLILVAHNPHIQELAERLSGPGSDTAALTRLRQKFPTGGLARLDYDGDWRDLDFDKARLTDFVIPRDIG